MQVSVTGKQIDVGDALNTRVAQSLTRAVDKYFDKAMEAHVTFSRERQNYRADISVHAGRGLLLQGHAVATDVHAAYDQAEDRIAKRLRRHKRWLRDHRNAPDGPALAARQYILAGDTRDDEVDEAAAAESGDRPVVVAEMSAEISTLTVGEAVMRMDLGDLPALLFRNSAHGGLNMVYRRADGNIGWVDPQGTPGDAKRPA